MSRSYLPRECALFALCNASGQDYTHASQAYRHRFGRPWGDEGNMGNWAAFARSELRLDVDETFFDAYANRAPWKCLWDTPRLLICVMDTGEAHMAYCDETNVVTDTSGSVPFAQWAKGRSMLAERIIPRRLDGSN